MLVLKKIVIFVSIFLLIAAALIYWRLKWVESIKLKDYISLEKEILLPDSDNKGFSDKVKNEIDLNFNDPQIRKAFYNFAKKTRILSRSKTEEEFIDNSKKSLMAFDCVLYLQLYYKPNEFKNMRPSISRNIVFDNKDMENFIIFLDKYRFGSSRFDKTMNDYMNKNQVNRSTEYEKICQE